MNDRKWYPVPTTEPITKPTLPDPAIDFLSWVNATPDEDERERARHLALVESTKLPTVAERIVALHSNVLLERRMLRREASRPVTRPGVVASVNERLAVYELELDNVLDAMVYHTEDWAHLPATCLICTKDVRL